jgi:cytochrome P450
VSTTDADHRPLALSTFAYFYSWRRMRRAAHEALTKVAVQRYHPVQTKEATLMVSAFLANPENREEHIQRAAASTIMSIMYDHPTIAQGKIRPSKTWIDSFTRAREQRLGHLLSSSFPG